MRCIIKVWVKVQKSLELLLGAVVKKKITRKEGKVGKSSDKGSKLAKLPSNNYLMTYHFSLKEK